MRTASHTTRGAGARQRSLGTQRARLGTLTGFGTLSAKLCTFKGFETELARLGNFRGFGTERARLGTFRGFLIFFFSKPQNLTQNRHW